MAEIEVIECGPATTIQDAGRFGLQRYGVGPAGAMDRDALTLANLLVGNDPDEAAIEFAGLGGRFRVKEGVVRIAIAGADAPLSVDGDPVAAQTSVTLRAGEEFAVGPTRSGMYAILALAGGLDVAPMLGSRSLHRRSAIGGLEGKPLAAGSILPLRKAAPDGEDLTLPDPLEPARGPIRVLLGPQDDYFTQAGIATFFESTYTLSRQADRMGYRLNGPAIEHSDGFNIISDGIVTGAIQVPGSGEPIVLMSDRQTTGGYPKIATIITPDLPRFAQLRPGDGVRFTQVTREEAIAAARENARRRADLRGRLIPAGAMDLTSERLLALNLVGGMVDARADFFETETA